MVRVHVICEGQTEEMFVKELLQPEFFPKGIYLNPMLVGKPGHKGGNFKLERLFTDVRNHLLSDRTSYCTTFFDFYGLPTSFPGKSTAADLTDIESKAETVREALYQALAEKLGDEAMRRFIPFVQMYEFELEDLVVVDREQGDTVFKRLNREDFATWLEDYTLGELWQKNILGGRPS